MEDSRAATQVSIHASDARGLRDRNIYSYAGDKGQRTVPHFRRACSHKRWRAFEFARYVHGWCALACYDFCPRDYAIHKCYDHSRNAPGDCNPSAGETPQGGNGRLPETSSILSVCNGYFGSRHLVHVCDAFGKGNSRAVQSTDRSLSGAWVSMFDRPDDDWRNGTDHVACRADNRSRDWKRYE